MTASTATPPVRLGELVRPRAPRRGRRGLALVGVAGALLGVGLLALPRGDNGAPTVALVTPPTDPTTTAVPVTAPESTQVWPSTSLPVGATPTVVLAGQTYAVGRPGDVAVAAVWGCPPGPATAVLLRPASGEVFLFPELATAGRDTTGTPLTTVIGARGLAVQDADDDGCTELVAERDGAEPAVIDTEVAT